MFKVALRLLFLTLASASGVAAALSGQATSSGLVVRTLAEVETRTREQGREMVHLRAAERVIPGDEIKYTLEVRNDTRSALRNPCIVQAVPAHTRYVGQSAAASGAEIYYSVDGGAHFDRAEALKVTDSSGRIRVAKPTEYTHILWRLRQPLDSNSVAFARFRALVE